MAGRSVAVLGLGGMGGGMARALLDAGFRVTVHNRTKEKAYPLVEAGASLAGTPGIAVADAEVVLLSLADEVAVEEVLFGAVAELLGPHQKVIDTSTVSPEFARQAAKRLSVRGVPRVEACVVGNPQMAEAGMLRVYAAGDQSEVDSVADVLGAIGQETRFLGAPGTASSLKLAFNLLLGVQTAGLAEAVSLVECAGLDREVALAALQDTGWGSLALGFRAEFMRERGYSPPGFRSVLMHKDLRLARQEAAAHQRRLPLVERAEERYESVVSAGRGDEDAAVIVES